MLLPLNHPEPLSVGLRAGGKWLNWAKSTLAKPVWETPFVAADHLQPCKPDRDFPALQEADIADHIMYLADSMVTFAGGQPVDATPIPPGMHGAEGPQFPLDDPGFEMVQVGDGKYQYSPTGSAWTFPVSSGISANNSPFTAGTPVAPEGHQVAFIQKIGSFSQSISGWTSGTYILSFQAIQRGTNQTAQQNFAVLIDDAVVGKCEPSASSYQRYVTDPFAVTAGSHTITFKGLNKAGGDNTAFVDTVVPFLVG